MSAHVFLSTTGPGLARAEHVSESWSVQHLLPGQDIRCLAVDPLRRGTVYAGTQGEGVLRSDDAGRTWQPAGLPGAVVKAVAASPVQPGVVVAGTKPARLYRSEDGGRAWHELEAFRRIPGRWLWRSPAEMPLTAYVQGIALSPTDPNIIVVGIEAGAVVRSADGGQTWSDHRHGALRDCHGLTFHATNGSYIYESGGTGAGAAISHSAGDAWAQPREGLDRHYGWACAADPARPGTWYVSASPMPRGLTPPPAHVDGKANAAIYRKHGEDPWQRLAGGLPQPLSHMAYGLLTDPTAPGHVYAGLSNGTIWHSADYGDTWESIPLDLGSIHRALVLM